MMAVATAALGAAAVWLILEPRLIALLEELFR
jgi:hypothetical protein